MPASLPVALNRDGIHSIEAPESFTTTGPFTIELDNHGEAVHVHLNLGEEISSAAHLSTGNHYVEAGATRSVDVAVAAVESEITGKLKIVTGYGNETRYVDVTVQPPEANQRSVDVDETLSKPQQRTQSESESLGSVFEQALPADTGTSLPVVALGGFAVLLALIVALTVNSPVVMLAAGVVLGGVLVALVLLWR